MAYQAVPLPRFLLGAAVVSVPALLLGGNPRWQQAYVFLILLMFVVYHSSGLRQFSAFLTKEFDNG